MSSETSTEARPFRPWHFFVLAGLVGATVAVYIVRPGDSAAVVILIAAVGAGAYVGYALYGTFLPLAARQYADRTDMVGGRTRAALDREKTLVLRSIKELEFDRAMGKVSMTDFNEMGGRLRSRARMLLGQLDAEGAGYRDQIERELADRLAAGGEERPASPQRQACEGCGTLNEPDAKFCKECGTALD